MNKIENKYRSFPFWSWNDKLDKKELIKQINWMHKSGIGGFFMHARGGLKTDYLGDDWFDCIKACEKRAKQLGMEAYAYDENGWPSGFVGGKLLENPENHDMEVTYNIGSFDEKASVSYDISSDKLTKTTKGENVLNVYLRNSASTADICNGKVVDQFIKLTHEEYKKADIYGNLRGFFTDEPQYYRWGTAYTRVLPEYFKKTYNEDIYEKLGLLFVEKEGYREFRYKYWKSMQALMLENFAKKIYTWCNDNGYKLTGHYCEENLLEGQMWCCAGIMPFYQYENIPGIDYLGRNLYRNPGPKQLGSVASQFDKKQRMAEIFACAGWDATPNELKLIAEYAMVGGVNILCPHLLPYSEHGQRKRDYPEHYSLINPWVKKNFRAFNDYFASIGEKLAKSEEIATVAVLHPIRSAYLGYKFNEPCRGLANFERSFMEEFMMLENTHLPFHFVDETILRDHGKIEDTQLVVGRCKYDFIIIPSVVSVIDKSTDDLLKDYVSKGGKILFLGDSLKYLEGVEHDFSYLKSNVTFKEIIDSQDMMVEESSNIVCSYYLDENGIPYIYALNSGEKTNVKVRSNGFKNTLINGEVCSDELSFDKYESKIIYFTNDSFVEKEDKNIIHLSNKFTCEKTNKNYLILDYLSISKDGVNYSNDGFYCGIFDRLLHERYEGDLYLKYNFDIKSLPKVCFALIEDTNTKSVFVNGHEVKKIGSILEKDLWKYNIAKHLKIGHNEIVVKMNFFEGENVYYALFGENVTESLRNCLAYDTTIEAIYLQGDFGVFGDFVDQDNCYVANKFYLDKQQSDVTNLVKDGFAFFRGDIKLTQYIDVNNTNSLLEFNNRFQLIEVYVNNKFVKSLMFENKVDLSNVLKPGLNKIDLVLTVSNRNLLGPHHSKALEELSVGPYTFENFNTWDEKFESPCILRRYSFVKVL